MPSRKHPAAGAPADAARPRRYSSEIARAICDAIAGGEPLADVCERPGRPDRYTLSRWLKTNQDFQAAYACALEVVADRYAAEIIALADGTGGDGAEPATGKRDSADTVARLKLRIDTRKWLMAKLAPNKYGDRIAAVAKATAAQPLNIHELSNEELDEIDAAGGEE
jgi:hypothetical protein